MWQIALRHLWFQDAPVKQVNWQTVLLDRAGWHGAHDLLVPGNVTLVPLPPYAPQLNPVERVWLYLRERHLSHRLLDGYDAIVDACCAAWNQLTPERLRSLTNYPYLQQVSG